MQTLILSLCAIMPTVLPLSSQQTKNICKYEKVITEEARKNNIDPALLASVIFVESSFRTRAVSPANACGLTQVIPKWTGGRETGGKKYTCEQLKRAKTSIKVGAKILGYIVKYYTKGNVDQALCMYNAGTVCLTNKNLYKKLYYVKKVRLIYDTITDGC